MTMAQNHPNGRGERRRSAEAHSLEKFIPKKINGKKRKAKIQLLEKETEDELRETLHNNMGLVE